MICGSIMGFRTYSPQNMASWHIEYFRLVEFEGGRQEGLSELPLKQVTDLPMRDALPVTGGKALPNSSRRRDSQRDRPCYISPSPLHSAQTLCPITCVHHNPLFVPSSLKMPRFNPFRPSLFDDEPLLPKTYIKWIFMLFSC